MRTIWAEITLDEDVMRHYIETNLMEDVGEMEFFEREFGWITESGFGLENACLMDEDEPLRYRYIQYVFRWAMRQSIEDESKDSPMPYEDWAKTQK